MTTVNINKQIMNYINQNNIEKVKLLIEQGAKINPVVKADLFDKYNSMSPLQLAIFNNNYEMVKLLVESGADINYVNNFTKSKTIGTSIYSVAHFNKNEEITNFLISKGINTKDINLIPMPCRDINNTVSLVQLLSMINNNEIKKVEKLFNDGLDISKYENLTPNSKYDNLTPLELATRNNSIDMIKLLVENGADLKYTSRNFLLSNNIHPYYRKSSILAIASKCSDETFKYIIDKAYEKHEDYTSFISNQERVNREVRELAYQGQTKKLEILIDKGVPLFPKYDMNIDKIECHNYRKFGLFSYALQNEQFETFEMLVKKAEKYNYEDENKSFNLDHHRSNRGIYNIHDEILELVVDFKISRSKYKFNREDIEEAFNIDYTEKMKKINDFDNKCLTLLTKKYNANLNSLTGLRGWNSAFSVYGGLEGCKYLLHTAIKSECFELAETLIDLGADINVKYADGTSLLHKAVTENTAGVCNRQQLWNTTKIKKEITFLLNNNINLESKGVNNAASIYEKLIGIDNSSSQLLYKAIAGSSNIELIKQVNQINNRLGININDNKTDVPHVVNIKSNNKDITKMHEKLAIDMAANSSNENTINVIPNSIHNSLDNSLTIAKPN